MDRITLHALLSPAGQALLAEAATLELSEASRLADLTLLRRRHPAALAAAALELARLRRRAAAKFSRAEAMVFTRAALEQASGEAIAAYRAGRYRALGVARVADLGCGIGGDALALAAGALVVGVDRDEGRLTMARENCRAYGRAERFCPVLADLTEWRPTGLEALFFDPGRRTAEGKRVYLTTRYRPPLTVSDGWRRLVPHLGVKVSPGISYDELPPEAEVEFISEAGTVKEAVLWFGDLRTAARRRATLLPSGATLTDGPHPPILVTRPLAYLYEPDGAVIRAHLVEELAAELGASKLDPDIAYLTAETLTPTPFARAYRIDEYLPFQLKRLRARLRELNIGRLVVKKRGSPLEPEALIRQLKLRGDEERTLFLTHLDGRPVALIGRPAAS